VAVPGDPVPPGIFHADLDAELNVVRPRIVPPGQYVLLGDNRADSFDSRIVGFFPGNRILGLVRARPAEDRSTLRAADHPS
jgi:signal peptidase I